MFVSQFEETGNDVINSIRYIFIKSHFFRADFQFKKLHFLNLLDKSYYADFVLINSPLQELRKKVRIPGLFLLVFLNVP